MEHYLQQHPKYLQYAQADSKINYKWAYDFSLKLPQVDVLGPQHRYKFQTDTYSGHDLISVREKVIKFDADLDLIFH